MMNLNVTGRRLAAAGLAVLLSMALAACLVLPGKFTSTLDLRKDGRFSFTYSGEIFLLGLSKLAQMDSAANDKFEPSACNNEDDDMTERECTKDELAQQQSEWEESHKAAVEKKKKEAEEMRAMLGGIDPSDPKAAEELAARLRRQAGFNRVDYKGDGLYDVDFAVSGHLDYDFTFPTMERVQMTLPFVVLNRRNDATVRFDAPAFTAANNGGMNAMGAGMAAGDPGMQDIPNMPQLDGHLVLTTDGQILANNTDEGPQKDPAGQKLEWHVTPRSGAAPTALIKLGS
ncbi:hypothetical protein [Novosphingobium sp.]|uniref:hypothetical protein n=1 Tax=Novosphingobium sp. TaxID=1874826 RepID=UPI002627F08D|nr:hypothetical protein [Novosphingobium sp.]